MVDVLSAEVLTQHLELLQAVLCLNFSLHRAGIVEYVEVNLPLSLLFDLLKPIYPDGFDLVPELPLALLSGRRLRLLQFRSDRLLRQVSSIRLKRELLWRYRLPL